MSPTSHADRELDTLIAEITVDSYDEDEALAGFATFFDEVEGIPCPATVIGEDVQVIWIGMADHRQELIATCQRAGQHYDVALLDIEIHAGPELSRLIAAYRRWVT